MRKEPFSILLAALCLGLSAGGCSLQAPSENAQNGGQTSQSYAFCTTCHGVGFRGNEAVDAPKLTGLGAWYLERQLRNFKSGRRGGHPMDVTGREMQPMAVAVADTDMASLADFISALPERIPSATLQGDREKGMRIYQAHCASCHGDDSEGNATIGAPRLTGQNDWYMLRQLQKFKSGARGSHPDDSHGAQMRAIMSALSDEQSMKDVLAYINRLTEQQYQLTDR